MHPSATEKAAKVSNFDRFGVFNMVYLLAGGDITKYDGVFNASYSEAFTTLARKAEETRYQQRIHTLLNPE